MQLPLEKKNLTVQEAADALNVRRERVWKLMADGVLTAEPSKLDGRQKLIPRAQVEALLLEEGYRPRRTVRRSMSRELRAESSGTVEAEARLWPKSIGMVSDGTVPSDQSETYMRQQLHGESVEAE
jgi:excisionase family DNA binding protein